MNSSVVPTASPTASPNNAPITLSFVAAGFILMRPSAPNLSSGNPVPLRLPNIPNVCVLGHRGWSALLSETDYRLLCPVIQRMSAYMSRVMSRRFRWAVHQRFTLLGDRRALRGSCDEVHVPCEGSHQLISGSSDPACHNAECMDHRRGGKDGFGVRFADRFGCWMERFSTAILATLPVTASGHPGYLGLTVFPRPDRTVDGP